MPNNGWSNAEIEAVVHDYFEMLLIELDGGDYNKAAHNRRLRLLLNQRTQSSVELKHQNISAILDEAGLKYIPGYKPKKNYQHALKLAIMQQIENNSVLRSRLRQSPPNTPSLPLVLITTLAAFSLCG